MDIVGGSRQLMRPTGGRTQEPSTTRGERLLLLRPPPPHLHLLTDISATGHVNDPFHLSPDLLCSAIKQPERGAEAALTFDAVLGHF